MVLLFRFILDCLFRVLLGLLWGGNVPQVSKMARSVFESNSILTGPFHMKSPGGLVPFEKKHYFCRALLQKVIL